MEIKGAMFLLIVVIALLVMPIVWLTLQVSEFVPFLTLGVILSSLVIAIVIVRKIRYEPFQQPYQHNRGFYTVRRIEKALASGAATMFVIGFITQSFMRPLLPGHFWHIYLAILFVLGAIIEDIIQRMLEKKGGVDQASKGLIKLPINLTVFYSHNPFAYFNSSHSPK